jgi:ABC-type transport system involved in cytochrome bd biosynthesis fused ATPase/permease subunit
MKKVFRFIVVFVAVVLLSACVASPAVAPQSAIAQGLVALPDEASVLILSLLTAGVAWLLAKVNMGQFTQPIAAALAPVIITALEGFLGTIPPVFDNLVLSLLHLLVLYVGGSIGVYVLAKRKPTNKGLLNE